MIKSRKDILQKLNKLKKEGNLTQKQIEDVDMIKDEYRRTVDKARNIEEQVAEMRKEICNLNLEKGRLLGHLEALSFLMSDDDEDSDDEGLSIIDHININPFEKPFKNNPNYKKWF